MWQMVVPRLWRGEFDPDTFGPTEVFDWRWAHPPNDVTDSPAIFDRDGDPVPGPWELTPKEAVALAIKTVSGPWVSPHKLLYWLYLAPLGQIDILTLGDKKKPWPPEGGGLEADVEATPRDKREAMGGAVPIPPDDIDVFWESSPGRLVGCFGAVNVLINYKPGGSVLLDSSMSTIVIANGAQEDGEALRLPCIDWLLASVYLLDNEFTRWFEPRLKLAGYARMAYALWLRDREGTADAPVYRPLPTPSPIGRALTVRGKSTLVLPGDDRGSAASTIAPADASTTGPVAQPGLDADRDELISFEQALRQRERELEEAAATHGTRVADLQKLEEALNEQKATVERQQGALGELRAALADEKAALEKQQAELEARSKALADAQAELEARRAAFAEDQRDLNATVQRLEEENAELIEKNRELEQWMEEYTDPEAGAQDEELVAAREALDSQREALEQQRNEVEQEQARLVYVGKTLAQAQQKLKRDQDALKQAQEAVATRERDVKAREDAAAAREQEVQKREDAVAAQEQVIAKVRDELARLQQLLDTVGNDPAADPDSGRNGGARET